MDNIIIFKISHQHNSLSVCFYSKCHKYSPSEPTKAYDKTVSRKTGIVFEPEQVLQYVEEPDAVRSHEQLVRDYLEVRIKTFHLSV